MLPLSWSLRDWFRALLVLSVSTLLGLAIWWTSPFFTGHVEPWDAEWGYYLGSLFIAGFLAALLLPKAFWLAPVGVYLGQLVFCVYLYEPAGASLWPLGMILAVFYCLAALLGALAGAIFMWVAAGLARILRFLTRSGKAARAV